MATISIIKQSNGLLAFDRSGLVGAIDAAVPDETVPLSKISSIRKDKNNSAAVVIAFVPDGDGIPEVVITPALDTFSIGVQGGTIDTYTPGQKTQQELYDIVRTHAVFLKANSGNGGSGDVTTAQLDAAVAGIIQTVATEGGIASATKPFLNVTADAGYAGRNILYIKIGSTYTFLKDLSPE